MSISLERRGMLKDGNYMARVKEAEIREGQNYPYVAVTLEVLDKSGKPTDRLLWDNVSLAPKAAFMFDQFLDSLDMKTEGNMSRTAFCRAITGKKCYITVGRKLYKGQYSNDVEGYLTEAAVESMTLSEADTYTPSYTNGDGDEDRGEPKAFSPSNPLEDDEEESEALVNVLDEDDNADEDIPF